MAAQMRRAETAQKIQKHRIKRFGGRDEEIEETGQEGNKTMRGQQGGIMNIGAYVGLFGIGRLNH